MPNILVKWSHEGSALHKLKYCQHLSVLSQVLRQLRRSWDEYLYEASKWSNWRAIGPWHHRRFLPRFAPQQPQMREVYRDAFLQWCCSGMELLSDTKQLPGFCSLQNRMHQIIQLFKQLHRTLHRTLHTASDFTGLGITMLIVAPEVQAFCWLLLVRIAFRPDKKVGPAVVHWRPVLFLYHVYCSCKLSFTMFYFYSLSFSFSLYLKSLQLVLLISAVAAARRILH